MSCSRNLYRLAIPEDKVAKRFRKGYGYNNGGFILNRNDVRLKNLIDFYQEYDFFGGKLQQIPCGKCIECRLAYSKEWAQRIVCESSLYPSDTNWFITLTYDEEHLVKNVKWSVDRRSGEVGYCPTLNKDDFTLWKKRLLEHLRRNYGHIGVRFYMCGEYGSKNGRPHFHCILMNCPLPDVKLVRKVSLGSSDYNYMSSKLVSDTWGKGFVMLGQVNWETASYVARYVMKKAFEQSEDDYLKLCQTVGVEPTQKEYVNMSRNPGIAKDYYINNWREIYELDTVLLPNGRTAKPSMYFDKLFDVHNSEELEKIKLRRSELQAFTELHKYKGLSPDEIDSHKRIAHDVLVRKLSKLHRKI